MSQGNGIYKFYKGRVAFFALLKVFGIGPGDYVLTPGYTCVVVPLAIHYTGAVPCYVDIDAGSFNCSYQNYLVAYERLAFEGKENKVAAVVIQHTYGNPNRDTQEICRWAKDKGMIVVEDCAHINGVTLAGKPAGTFGDAAFYSTQWSKPFTTGLGGFARLNGTKHAKIMAAMENVAPKPRLGQACILAAQLAAHHLFLRPSAYWFAVQTHRKLAKMGLFIGSSQAQELNGKMPEDYFKGMGWLQRFLFDKRSVQMEAVNRHRILLAGEYSRLLTQRGLPAFTGEQGAVLIRYPIRVNDKAACLREAKTARVELGDWFDHPLHPLGTCLDGLNWDGSLCPNAVKAAGEVVNLPLHPRVDEREIKKSIDFIAGFVLPRSDIDPVFACEKKARPESLKSPAAGIVQSSADRRQVGLE